MVPGLIGQFCVIMNEEREQVIWNSDPSKFMSYRDWYNNTFMTIQQQQHFETYSHPEQYSDEIQSNVIVPPQISLDENSTLFDGDDDDDIFGILSNDPDEMKITSSTMNSQYSNLTMEQSIALYTDAILTDNTIVYTNLWEIITKYRTLKIHEIDALLKSNPVHCKLDAIFTLWTQIDLFTEGCVDYKEIIVWEEEEEQSKIQTVSLYLTCMGSEGHFTRAPIKFDQKYAKMVNIMLALRVPLVFFKKSFPKQVPWLENAYELFKEEYDSFDSNTTPYTKQLKTIQWGAILSNDLKNQIQTYFDRLAEDIGIMVKSYKSCRCMQWTIFFNQNVVQIQCAKKMYLSPSTSPDRIKVNHIISCFS